MKKETKTLQLFAVLKEASGLKRGIPLKQLGLRVLSMDYERDHIELAMKDGGVLLTFISKIHRFYSREAA